MSQAFSDFEKSKNIELINDRLIIHELITADASIVSLAKSQSENGKNLEILIEQMLELGAKVISFGADSAQIALLDNAVKSASVEIGESAKQLQEATSKSLSELVQPDGKLSTGIKIALNDLRTNLDQVISGEDAPLKKVFNDQISKVEEAVRKVSSDAFTTQKQNLADLLNPDNSMSPLQNLQQRIKDLDEKLSGFISATDTDAQVKLAEETLVNKTTLKGGSYESIAAESLIEVARNQGDTCEHTGDKANGAIKNSKRGDAVSTFIGAAGQSLRIVMEAKNEKLDSKQWLEEAKFARKNRSAIGFIGMAKSVDQVPGEQRLWIKDQKTIVIAFDPEVDNLLILETVYKLLKISVLSHMGELDEDSLATVSLKLSEATLLLDKFSESDRDISSIRKATDKLKASLDDLHSEMQTTLKAASDALKSSFSEEELTTDTEDSFIDSGT